MSQETLSFEADIHRTYLSDLELGHRNPSLKTLLSIARALKVTLLELTSFDSIHDSTHDSTK